MFATPAAMSGSAESEDICQESSSGEAKEGILWKDMVRTGRTGLVRLDGPQEAEGRSAHEWGQAVSSGVWEVVALSEEEGPGSGSREDNTASNMLSLRDARAFS